MRLEDLCPNFLNLLESNQLAFVSSYRKKRAADLVPVVKERDTSKIDISVSEDELRKLLGLTKREYLQLKLLAATPKEEEEEDVNDEAFEA